MSEKWKQFTAGAPVAEGLSNFIQESWQRCRSFELDHARANLRRLPLPEVQRLLDQNEELIRAARPHLAWALEAMAPLHPVIIILADANGIVLDSIGNAPEAMVSFGLIPGYDWSERAMGTNGIGTALTFGEPVAVLGPEHYIATWHNNTCVGAPIRDANGKITGAVDISTLASDGDPARLVMASLLAHLVGRDLGSTAASFPDRAVISRADAPEGSVHGAALERHAAELAGLADKLLDAARLHARRLSVVREQVELRPLLERVAEQHRGVTLGDGAGKALFGSWDAVRLEQAMSQLVKAIGRGGARVEVQVGSEAELVRIAIREAGGGGNAGPAGWTIDKAAPALGLWIAKQIAGALGGRVLEAGGELREFVLELPRSIAAD